MTDPKPAAGRCSSAESNKSDKPGDEEAPKAAIGATGNKHVVRILGTYSMFTFFEKDAQEKFFKTITSREFESIFDPDSVPAYLKDTVPFHFLFSKKERQFELQMTNMGFIREAFWKEAFPPIFQLNGDPTKPQTWESRFPNCTKCTLDLAAADPKSNKHAEAVFYRFCLARLAKELNEIGEQQEIHIGLNRFGIVNIGITIKLDGKENCSFDDLCKDAYKKVSHLQEDPLKDCEAQWTNGGKGTDPVVTALKQCEKPRLLVSYFQVLAITTIHTFLHDKLVAKAIPGFQKECLANPWELSNKIPESTRYGLPPLRHVVFMYQLVHSISDKTSFLRNNRRALLTLGHNVGCSPSWNPPFPLFDSKQARLKDSSLLKTSCCLIFPQGLVVVIPPDPDPGKKEYQKVYPGGWGGNPASPSVLYREYWKLIFKLFIRVAEARLLIGMVNRELSDIHKAFLKNRQAWWYSPRGILSIYKIHSRLMRVGSIIQRTSGRVITPEVTRYSFVRIKLTDFLETVNFEEHRGYIQSEFEKLNEWVGAIRTTFLAWSAMVVALFIGAIQVVAPQMHPSNGSADAKPPNCVDQSFPELIKGLSGEMDNLKESTAAVNSEMKQLQAKIGPLAKDLEALKRCKHHNREDTTAKMAGFELGR